MYDFPFKLPLHSTDVVQDTPRSTMAASSTMFICSSLQYWLLYLDTAAVHFLSVI